jgi:hypothetical protein
MGNEWNAGDPVTRKKGKNRGWSLSTRYKTIVQETKEGDKGKEKKEAKNDNSRLSMKQRNECEGREQSKACLQSGGSE